MRPSKKSGSGKRSLPVLTTSSMSWCTRGAMGRRRSSLWSRTEAPYRGRGELFTRVRRRGFLRTSLRNGVLRSSQAPLRGSGDVLPKQLLAPDADRGVAMDQFPFTVLPTEHAGITEGYLRAIG